MDQRIVRATKEHRAFVLSTWLRSKWQLVKDEITHKTFIDGEQALAEERFAAGLVWIHTEDGYSVNGWVSGVRDSLDTTVDGVLLRKGSYRLLHYVYVAPELRGMGLGRKLVTQAIGVKPEVLLCPRKLKVLLCKESKSPEQTKRFMSCLGTYNPYRIKEI